MKKAFGLIALLGCAAAMTVSPALANDRNDYRDAHKTYVVDRDHDRRDHDRDRDRRVDVRDTRYVGPTNVPYCR
jgi:hypothetical protein